MTQRRAGAGQDAARAAALAELRPEQSVELLKALGNPHANLPFTLAIDGDGRIVGRKLGVMSGSELDQLLKSLR